jgi:hypothetical protein
VKNVLRELAAVRCRTHMTTPDAAGFPTGV